MRFERAVVVVGSVLVATGCVGPTPRSGGARSVTAFPTRFEVDGVRVYQWLAPDDSSSGEATGR